MSIDRSEIDHLCHLARFSLSESEKEHLFNDLNNIVGYVDRLNEVDTEGVEPMTHAQLKCLSPRADEVQPHLGRKAVEGSAGYEDGLVRVPKIIE